MPPPYNGIFAMDVSTFIGVIKDYVKADSLSIAVLISIVVSVLRSILKGGDKKEVVLEPLLCGCLTFVAVSIGEYLKIPSDLTVAIGGFVGFMGVKKISGLLDQMIKSKIS
ncbi:phage holin, lambda family [Cobetia sp. MMG027]|uniref:phage holin, lambda family n=1 Tax=Cobetia sp. MMG027 TaxID=3021980 RepID=UPI003FA4CA91